jgi:hypothetical protein
MLAHGPTSGKRKSRDRSDQTVRLGDQPDGLCLDRPSVESSALEHIDHLAGDLVAPRGDRVDA